MNNKKLNEDFLYAVLAGDYEKIKDIFEKGADIRCADENGYYALHKTIHNCDAECVRLLISLGADVHVKDRHGRNAMHLMAKEGRIDLMSVLIEHGVDIDVLDDGGWTPMVYAEDDEMTVVIEFIDHYRASQTEQKALDGLIASGDETHKPIGF